MRAMGTLGKYHSKLTTTVSQYHRGRNTRRPTPPSPVKHLTTAPMAQHTYAHTAEKHTDESNYSYTLSPETAGSHIPSPLLPLHAQAPTHTPDSMPLPLPLFSCSSTHQLDATHPTSPQSGSDGPSALDTA